MSRVTPDYCIQRVMQATGLDSNGALDALTRMDKERETLRLLGELDRTDFDLELVARGLGEEALEAAALEKRRTVKAVLLGKRWERDVDMFVAAGKMRPDQALDAKMLGTHKGLPGGRVSIAARPCRTVLACAGVSAGDGERDGGCFAPVLGMLPPF